MSDTSLLFNVLAKDNTAAGLRSAEGNFNRLGSGVRKLGALIAGAFAVDKIGEFVTSSVEAAESEAKLGRLTAAAITASGGAAHVTAGQIEELSIAQSNKTATDVGIIHSGANMLLTFSAIQDGVGKVKDMFELTQQASMDMAAGMNNGTLTTGGLDSASLKLGKAMTDPVKGMTALTRAGVVLSPVQQATIKSLMATGSAADLQTAQMMILTAVNKKFAGAAEANLDPLTKLHNQMHNISLIIGTALLPMVTGLASYLSDHVVPAVKHFLDNLQHGGGAFKTVRDGVSSVIGAVKKLWGDLTGIGGKIGKELGRIDFSGIATTIVADAKSWGSGIIAGIKTGLDTGDWSALGSSIGSGISSALLATGNLAATLGGWFTAQVAKVNWFDLGMSSAGEMVTFLGGLLIGIISYDPTPLFTGMARHWKATLLGALVLATGGLGKLLGPVFELLGREGAPFLLRGLAFLAEHGLRALEDAAKYIVKGGGKLLGSLFTKLFPDLAKLGVTGIGKVGEAIARVKWWVALIKIAGQGLSALPKVLIAAGVLAIDSFLHAIVGAAPAVWDWFKSLPGTIGGFLAGAGSWLLQAGSAIIHGLISGIESAIPGLHTVLGGLTSLIPSWKGPPAKDRALLHPAGVSIIQGLVAGMASQYAGVSLSLGKLTVAIKKNTAAGIKAATDSLLAQATTMLDALKQKLSDARDLQTSIQASMISGADITSMDVSGGPQGLLANLTDQANQAQQFATDIAALRKVGLNAATLGQIQDAGVSGGLATAQSLLAGPSNIAGINTQEARISGAGAATGRGAAIAQYGIDPDAANKLLVKLGKQHVTVGFDFTNTGDDAFVALIRKAIRVKGGNVQVALGSK